MVAALTLPGRDRIISLHENHRRFLLCLCLCAPAAFSADTGPLRGYSTDSARAERDWETKFRAIPDPANCAPTCSGSARPHHVGSPYDKDNAEWILAKFKEWGLDAQDRNLRRSLPHPEGARARTGRADASSPPSLQSRRSPADPTSSQHDEQLPVYNAYSIDGDVTAPLVYVNYGIPDDYEQLDRLGISVKGAIVIARYGESWRGIKPKVAAEHGAVGCLIYSDPHEDGYFQGDVFPDGPFRPQGRRAARQRDGYAGLSRRSADARRRRHQGRQAAAAERSHHLHQDSRAADFLRRRAAAAGRAEGPGRAGGLARRAAHHLSRRARPGQGASEG